MTYTLDQVLQLDNSQLYDIVRQAHPLDLEALADTSYTGIDLSMPAIFHKLFWKLFRKTFHRDPKTGVLRGWNVKVQQTGWDKPPAPKLNKSGKPLTFGHYEVRSARGLKFPRGWQGSDYLDYRVAGNTFFDFPARTGYCPLVAVNKGSMDLLLGWEVFNISGLQIPLNDFWLLKREGPLTVADVVPRPRP